MSALEMGRWQEAELLLRQAVEANPSDPESRRHLAESLWQRGAKSEAIQQIEAARALASSDAPLAVRTGEMRLAIGDSRRALECAERALALDPKLPESWALRGRARWQLQDQQGALADLQRALHYSPSATDSLLDMAQLYYQLGQPQRCLTTLQRLLDLNAGEEEPLEALILEGRAYLALGLSQPASERFAQVKNRAVPSAELCCLIAQAELGAGRTEAALAAAQEAVAIDAGHLESRQLLAQLVAANTSLR